MKIIYRFFESEGRRREKGWDFTEMGDGEGVFGDNRFRFFEIYYPFGDFLGEA